jgi:hypothetical protein
MADNDNFVTITRLIEMHGPREWINEVLKKSFVPINGTRAIGAKGAYMRGGVVMWSPQPEEAEEAPFVPSPAEVEADNMEQPAHPRFEDTLKSQPSRNAPAPLRVPKPTGVK